MEENEILFIAKTSYHYSEWNKSDKPDMESYSVQTSLECNSENPKNELSIIMAYIRGYTAICGMAWVAFSVSGSIGENWSFNFSANVDEADVPEKMILTEEQLLGWEGVSIDDRTSAWEVAQTKAHAYEAAIRAMMKAEQQNE